MLNLLLKDTFLSSTYAAHACKVESLDVVRDACCTLLQLDRNVTWEVEDEIMRKAEKLQELDHVNIDHETLRWLMITQSLWKVVRSQKVKKHVWRERKHHFGEMIQAGGSLMVC